MAGISDDIDKLRVNRDDFMHAFDEVQPAFGVSEEELQTVVQNGIYHFHAGIEVGAQAVVRSRTKVILFLSSPYWKTVHFSLSKCAVQFALPGSPSFSMVPRDQERQH